MNIESEGVIYCIKKEYGEVNNIYFDRVGTIIKKMPLKFTEKDYEKVKTEVEQEIVKKHLGCEY